MNNTNTNNSISGKYYWWAQSAPVDILTRKFRNQSPKVNDSFHMLRDSTACLFLSELIKKKYDFGGVLYNMPTDIFFPEKRLKLAHRTRQTTRRARRRKEKQFYYSLPRSTWLQAF